MRKGFTLIEMLIAISLVAVMSGIGIAGYINANRQSKVDQATARLKQLYVAAKANSLAGKKDCSLCGGADATCDGFDDLALQGWRVSILGNTLTTEGLCGNTEYPAGSPVIFASSQETIASDLTLYVSNTQPILFRVKNGGIYPRISSGSTIVVRVSSSGATSKQFSIYGSGEVR